MKYGEKGTHNPIMAVWDDGSGSLKVEKNIGFTKQDCIKWMKSKVKCESVDFMRLVVTLSGSIKEVYNLKEDAAVIIDEAAPKTRRRKKAVEAPVELPFDTTVDVAVEAQLEG